MLLKSKLPISNDWKWSISVKRLDSSRRSALVIGSVPFGRFSCNATERYGRLTSPNLSRAGPDPWLIGDCHEWVEIDHFQSFEIGSFDCIYTAGSLASSRSRDPISYAIRCKRDKLPESAQCDSNTISCAVALYFRFFLPFFYTTCQKVLGQFYGAICFRWFLRLYYCWIF